jgi:hypothetical protein
VQAGGGDDIVERKEREQNLLEPFPRIIDFKKKLGSCVLSKRRQSFQDNGWSFK